MTAALHDLSLAEALDGADDEEIVAPESREHVDRLLGRLARVRTARDRDVADAEVRRAQIDAWLEARLAVHDNATQHIEAVLTAWHEYLLGLDPKAKTVSLPNGTLKSRARSASIKVTDEATFIEWAKANAVELVRTRVTEAPDRTVVAATFEIAVVDGEPIVVNPTTGERPPGCTVDPGGRSFSIEVTQPEEVIS